MSASGILVIIEIEAGMATPLSYEVLGLARRLGDEQGHEVTAMVLGAGLGEAGKDLPSRGADRVVRIDHPALGDYQADAWLPDIAKTARNLAPALIFAGHSTVGLDMAPRLAFRLESAVTTACIEIAAKGGKLLFTRNCFGGKAREVSSFRTTTVVATILPKSQEALPTDPARSGEIVDRDSVLEANAIRTRIVERVHDENTSAALETAKIIVAGGGGVNGPDGFRKARELARALGGALGATRLACDLGWCAPDLQIGVSGRTVAPELYFAIGISGAAHHIAGCANSKAIVAINSDADAPIFALSRFGIVGDCHDLMPALVAAVEVTKT